MGLCLTRFVDQQIWIGDDIVITIVDTRPDRVRLHIDAPRELRVDRHEVRQARQREAAAAQAGSAE